MKKFIYFAAFIFVSVNSWAYDFLNNGIAYNIISTVAPYKVEITSGGTYNGTITIPNLVTNNGSSYSVTSIGSSAFWNCSGLTSIAIPSTVTSIGDNTFVGCTSLTSIFIPSSVTSIGSRAFYFCSGLTSITIPSSVNSIIDWPFENCSSLTSIIVDAANPNYSSVDGLLFNKNKTILKGCPGSKTGFYIIPSTVTSIGDFAFDGCTSLTSVTIPNSVTSIGNGAFFSCTSLTSFTIPGSVTSIGYSTFYGCMGLASVSIPSSVTSIGNWVFNGCSGLTSITIPSSVTSIGESAFQGCTSLTSITISSSVISIGNGAFGGCSGLTSVTIPSSVTSIGESAFQGCTGLTSITIPSSVTSIGRYAFQSCTGLTSIYAQKSPPVDLSSVYGVFNNVNTTTCTLYVPIGSKATYKIAVQWNNFKNIVEPSTTLNITAGGLSTALTATELSTLTNLTITGTIDARDFKTMRDLMPNLAIIDLSRATIGAYTGSGGTSTSTGNIVYPVNTVPDYAFSTGWSSSKLILTSIALPLTATSIGTSAFYYCSSLTSITIPSLVISIGNGAFGGCSGLTSITIPSLVISIGNGAFGGCSGLTSVTIPSSVTSIGESAFQGCTGLTSITIPSSVTSIRNEAFTFCTGLTSITIPSSVTSIGMGAFYCCTGLTSVTIPSSVTSIGGSAFQGCTGLTSIHTQKLTPVNIKNSTNVFGDVNKTTCTLHVPIGSKTAYQNAVQWRDFANIIEITTAVPTILDSKISIYPNPVIDGFIINGFEGEVLLQLTYLNGKAILKKHVLANEKISVNSLQKGIYIVILSNNEITYQKKLIKE